MNKRDMSRVIKPLEKLPFESEDSYSSSDGDDEERISTQLKHEANKARLLRKYNRRKKHLKRVIVNIHTSHIVFPLG